MGAPPQYSPDGAWFWDGRRWIPARDGPPGERPPTAPPAPPVEDRPAAVAARPRLVRVPLVAMVAIAVATVLLAGGTFGLGWRAGTASPRAGATPTPYPLPSLAPAARDYQYIPGLRVSDLIRTSQDHGLTCHAPTVFGKDMAEWKCQAMTKGTSFSVEFIGRGEAKVWAVTVRVDGGDHRPARRLAAPLLEDVAELPVRSRPSLANDVHAWMEADFGLTTDAYFNYAQYTYSFDASTYSIGISGG